MAKLTNYQKIISLQTKGRFGRPSSFGRVHFGFNSLGIDDAPCGTYQGVTYKKSKGIQIQHFYFAKNPQSPAQTLRRNYFKDGVSAYHALTPIQLSAINRLGKARRMTGFNLFMSRWLRAG